MEFPAVRIVRILLVLIIAFMLLVSWNWILGTVLQNIGISFYIKDCASQNIQITGLQITECKASPFTYSLLQRAISLKPSASTTRILAGASFAQQNYQQAEDLYKRAIQLEPDNPINHLKLGYFYYAINDRLKAVSEWQKTDVAWLFLSEVTDYWEKGDIGDVLDIYGILLSLDESIIPIKLRIDAGWAYYEMGDKPTALSQFESAVHYSAAESVVIQSIANGELGIYYAREYQCRDNAITFLTKAVRYSEHISIFQVWLGECFRQLKKYDHAETELLIASGSRDGNIRSYAFLRLGQMYIEQSRTHEAIQALENACLLIPESIECHSSLADAYQASSNLVKALAQYEMILRLDPNNDGYRAKYMEIQSRLNK